jgi:hypothetical protein
MPYRARRDTMSDQNQKPNVFDSMTQADMLAELQRLTEEIAKIKSTKRPGVSFKVTEKGGVSLYGIGRFPVTLYKTQWEALISAIDSLKAFLAENDAKLTEKPHGSVTVKPSA